MSAPTVPHPLFETYARFSELNFGSLEAELPRITDYLLTFPVELKAMEGYRAVRSLLES